MKTLFLDTGYIIALEAADDQHHTMALSHWQNLTKSLPLLVTNSYVLDEVVTFFNCRNRHAKAVEIGNRLLTSSAVRLIHIDEPLFYKVWHYFVQHTDKLYSLTECASFVLMKKLNIRTALTFDKHFMQAGFNQEPQI